ncbi:MAG: hypothetical protein GY928_11175 [Colwellia sp.]|nr:hypothetical protein [Colwellia sp.]
MRYQYITSAIWHDPKFIKLTPEAQRLFLYLLTCPHGNIIGMFVLKEGYACADLQVLNKAFRKDLASLCEHFILHDQNNQVIIIKQFLKYNKLTNTNQKKAALTRLEELPKSLILIDYLRTCEGLSEVLDEGVIEGLSKDLGNISIIPVPVPVPVPVPGISTFDTDFNQFWLAYPKKVGKPDALKKFKTVYKKSDCNGNFMNLILNAIELQKKSDQWQNPKYIPNPATWLNQERFNDEVVIDENQGLNVTQISILESRRRRLEEEKKQKELK